MPLNWKTTLEEKGGSGASSIDGGGRQVGIIVDTVRRRAGLQRRRVVDEFRRERCALQIGEEGCPDEISGFHAFADN